MSRVLSTIPAAIFVLFSCLCLESDVFHPVLLANLFALLSLNSLFEIYKKHMPIAIIFNSGLFMSMAMLIYPPYVVFILLLFVGLISLRSLELKEVLQLLIGSLAPLYLIGVYFFLNDSLPQLRQHFTDNLALPWKHITYEAKFLAKPIIVITLGLIMMLFSNIVSKKKKYDATKKIELCYWMLLLSIATTFFSKSLTENHLMVTAIPIAIIGGIIMESKSNKVIKEFLFIIMIASYFVFQLGII